jgi:ribonucleotide reductase beta subunit family protein with ferritin-like domain
VRIGVGVTVSDVHLHDPQTLYRRWEHEQWNPWSIDLTVDRDQWQAALSEEDKGLVYWALSSLMVAEERITTKFAGLVITTTSSATSATASGICGKPPSATQR